MATEPVEVATTEFEVCWDRLDLGELPYPLSLPSPGETDIQRRVLEREALSALARRGLAAAPGPGPWLEWALQMLAAPSWAVDAWFYPRGEPRFSARAGVRGEDAVLAVLIGTQVRLHHLSDHAVLPALAELTGRDQRPRTAGARLPAEVVEQLVTAAAADKLAAVVEDLIDDGEPDGQVRAAAHALRGVGDRGEFRIALSDGHGGIRRLPDRVRWHTTDQGLFLRAEQGDFSTLTPAGHAQVVARLRELAEC
ncbi:ESX secretion-associated protein EspG [Crossiella sp. S99.1]|uniref:ESX secretion-associated protein EspG n=1 Tax=Crossiella sp. S99.1 TaxID=2936271 RepID=UPI001FFE86DD|nr:ESX secretion-associated protein EspG [Crossiella sp. S99.1]